MELLKLLSANEIVAQVLSFFLVLFLLRMFAWKRLLKLLDDRRERIASEFKKIEDGHAQIAKIKDEYAVKLDIIADNAKQEIQKAIAEGRDAAEEIKKKAHQEAQDIIQNARENIKHELSKAKEELKDKIIDLTISAAESVIQDRLTEEEDKRLVKDFLEKIDEIA